MNNYIIRDGELYHYGVLGMKWGVRKARKAQTKYAAKAERQANQHNRNASSIKQLLKNGMDEGGMPLDKETKNAYKHELRRSVEDGKKWLKTRDDILSLNVSDVTSKDIKNRYRDTYRNQGASYYPFA